LIKRNTTDYTSTYGESKDKGTLAPFVSKYLLSDCESCVLDGEMMALDTETGIYDKFGTLKTVNKDILENKPTKKIIIYVIFDIVYYNRVSLSSTTLEDRFQYLSKVFSDLDGSENVRIAKHEVGFTKEHIYKALEIRMDDFEEGLVAKNPLSLYSPSGKKDWLKIKPEYFKQMNDDVDLLIIGGYYGKGKYRRGKLSTFLCAVLDDTCTEERFVSFCKFGSGFSVELLPSISLEAQGNWKTFDPNVNLPWLVHVYGKENPDMYLNLI
jgi:DNA ligase-4